MFMMVLLLAVSDPTPAKPAPPEPSKFPVVREIESIGGSGSTLLSYDVDAKGKAKNCMVLEPSGSTYLDEQACKTLLTKAKFRPTLNEKGKPVATSGRTVRIRWKITG